MKRFLKPQKLESTPHLTHDDDSTGSDTLCDSEGLEDSETRPTTDLSTRPVKTVTFDLSRDESTRSSTPYHANESESDDGSDNDSVNTQQPTSQNDKADARLVHVVWLRKASDNVYMSNRKAMNLRTYIHAAHRRTETTALLDSGATENFMNLTYAKWLKLPFKRLAKERPLFNVDKQIWLHQILCGLGDADRQ